MPFFNKRYHPVGTAPGALAKSPSPESRPLRIRAFNYTAESFHAQDDTRLSHCKAYQEHPSNTWIHIEGHPDEETLKELAASFGIHMLALEDVNNSGQRPKVESYGDQIFVIAAMPKMTDGLIDVGQVSFIISGTILISFCEFDFSRFEPIVSRLRNEAGACGAVALISCCIACRTSQLTKVFRCWRISERSLKSSKPRY